MQRAYEDMTKETKAVSEAMSRLQVGSTLQAPPPVSLDESKDDDDEEEEDEEEEEDDDDEEGTLTLYIYLHAFLFSLAHQKI